jgi:hypothetical protein
LPFEAYYLHLAKVKDIQAAVLVKVSASNFPVIGKMVEV